MMKPSNPEKLEVTKGALHPNKMRLGPCCGAWHRARWFFSWLRLPILPARLGAGLPNTTWGEGILYGGFLLIVPYTMYYCLYFLRDDSVQQINSSGALASWPLYISFLLGHKQVTAIANHLFGLSFDRMIPFHKLVSKIAVILGVFHGWLAYLKWGERVQTRDSEIIESSHWEAIDYDNVTGLTTAQPNVSFAYALPATGHTTFSNVMKWSVDGWVNYTGTFLTLAMSILTLTSMVSTFRRKAYYTWLMSHISLSVLVLGFGVAHFGVGVPLILTWGADLFYRYVLKACFKYPHDATVKPIGETGVVRLSWPKSKSFFYQPGQFVKVGFPAADKLVFHPMSLASCPEVDEEEVVVYVRAMGPWSRTLLKNAKESVNTVPNDDGDFEETAKEGTGKLKVYLEGPYGSMGIDLYADRKHVLLCISGGVGVSPCIGMAKWLLATDKVAKARFVWSVREWELVEEALPDVLWDHSGLISPKKTRSDTSRMELTGSTKSLRDEENQMQVVDEKQDAEDDDPNKDRSRRLVETDLYMTSAPAGRPEQKTPTATVFHGVRPNWGEVFERTRKDALRLGYSRVSVVCCGPMMQDIQRACRQYSRHEDNVRVNFDLHEESFEF